MDPERQPQALQPQMYTQTGAAPQAFQYQVPPRLIPFSKKWHVAKIVLRTVSITLCIICIGINTAIMADEFGDDLFFGFSISPAITALIWDAAELITVCATGGERGIHPGAHVGMHLSISLSVIVCLTFAAIAYELYECDVERCYNSASGNSSEAARMYAMMIAAMTFLGLLFIVQFTLFVRACVETHLRNRAKSPTIIVYNPQGGALPPGVQMAMPVYVEPQRGLAPVVYAPPQAEQQQPATELKAQVTGTSAGPTLVDESASTSAPPQQH